MTGGKLWVFSLTGGRLANKTVWTWSNEEIVSFKLLIFMFDFFSLPCFPLGSTAGCT